MLKNNLISVTIMGVMMLKMPEWSTSCKNWEERIVKGESLIPFEPLFPDYGKKALDIFCELRIVDLPGRPRLGEISRQWILDLVYVLFGMYDEKNGKQLIREVFLLVPKKNTKSTLASAVMMTSLILGWREAAEFIILAPTKKVADNSFTPAMNMCSEDVDEDLHDMMLTQEHIKRITKIDKKSTLSVIATDSKTVAGIKGTGHFVDEVHEWSNVASAESMFREATGGMRSRTDGFIVWATTQSSFAPAGFFLNKLRYARSVRDGRVNDPSFLPILYEFPESYIDDKKYLNPENWHIVNPNMGASIHLDDLIREYKKAVFAGESDTQDFLAKSLNIQIDIAFKETRWAGADFWKDAGGNVTLEFILEECEVVVAGLDGGGLDDLLGLAILGRERMKRNDKGEPLPQKWYLWNRAWCHPIALERRKQFAPKYRDFEKDGDLRIVDGIGQDVIEACDIIMKCDASGLLDNVGVDPHGIGDIVNELERREFEFDRIKSVPQGWRLTGAIKTAGRKVAEKTIMHANQNLMAWCVGNAMGVMRGNAESITKEASGSGKIDPLMATFNCVELMARNPEARSAKSIYDGMSVDEIVKRMSM